MPRGAAARLENERGHLREMLELEAHEKLHVMCNTRHRQDIKPPRRCQTLAARPNGLVHLPRSSSNGPVCEGGRDEE